MTWHWRRRRHSSRGTAPSLDGTRSSLHHCCCPCRWSSSRWKRPLTTVTTTTTAITTTTTAMTAIIRCYREFSIIVISHATILDTKVLLFLITKNHKLLLFSAVWRYYWADYYCQSTLYLVLIAFVARLQTFLTAKGWWTCCANICCIIALNKVCRYVVCPLLYK